MVYATKSLRILINIIMKTFNFSFNRLYTIILCVLMVAVANAQNGVKSINGIVVDEEQNPLPGVTIQIKGKKQGVITDIDGKFSLQVKAQDQLIFSYIGYTTKTVVVGENNTLKVLLREDVTQLKDVVVIGYGTVKKKDLTGAIQNIAGEDLMKAMNTNISESLNGRIGGVMVNKTSNKPGSDMSVEIRGINSFNTSNEPLYVIDGVPSLSGMKHLNAADIESIDVLKDASSGAIYGSRGANGVVIITTKGASRQNEGFHVDYNGYFGVKTPTRIPDMIGNKGNGMDFVNYREKLWKKIYGPNSIYREDYLTREEKNRIRNGEFYDWLREVSHDGYVTNHSINASGKTEKTSYFLGLSYMLDQGLVANEDYKRYTANIGIEHSPTKYFTIGLSSYISASNSDMGSNEALINAYYIPPIVSPYDENGDYLFNCQPNSSKINPFIQIQNNIKQREDFYANLRAFMQVKPLEALTLKTQVAFQHDSDLTGEWTGTFTQAKGGVNPPSAGRWEGRNMNIVWDNTATYSQLFNKHKLDAIGLFSLQKETHQNSSITADGIPYESKWHALQTADKITGAGSSYWEASMASFMLRANYNYDERYLLTLTGRYDGTSRLSTGNQWGFMPSVALGWQIKNESFLKDVSWVDNLKLRLSWGKSGNNNIGHDITWTKLNQNRYSFDNKGENTFGLSSVKGNKDLKWEMTKEWNLGLDFGFLNNRITGSIDVYNRQTDDLIMARSVGRVNGFETIWENIGVTQNRGLEISLNTVNISTKDFYWKTGITFSLNRNKILELYGDGKDDLANRWFIGEPMRVDYNLKQLGVWQEEEAEEAKRYGQVPGQIKVWDKDDNGSIDEEDYTILSPLGMPDWTGGMTNTFVYKNFDLSIFAYARVGGMYGDEFTYGFTSNDNEHWNKLDVEYWTPENRNNKWPSVGAQSYYTQVLGRVNGTFLKIQNITLGYTFPKQIIKKAMLNDLRLYFSAQNPFTFSSYLGSDPEVIGENLATQLSLYPMSFSFGVNVKF